MRLRFDFSPSSKFIESIIIDLPAPVSPVRAVKPGSKSMSISFIEATFSMCSDTSIEYYRPSVFIITYFQLSQEAFLEAQTRPQRFSPLKIRCRLRLCCLRSYQYRGDQWRRRLRKP